MDNKHDLEPLLPKEFAHLEGDLRAAQLQLDEIDGYMENLKNNSAPTLDFTRPDFNPPEYRQPRRDIAGMTKQLEDRKAAVRQVFNEKLETNLVNTDPKTANNVRDAVDINLSDNKLRKMDRAEVKAQGNKPKEIDKSEEFLNKTLANYRAVKVDKETIPSASKNTDSKMISASDRFSMSLNFTIALDKTETISNPDKTSPEKSGLPEIKNPEIDPDKE